MWEGYDNEDYNGDDYDANYDDKDAGDYDDEPFLLISLRCK